MTAALPTKVNMQARIFSCVVKTCSCETRMELAGANLDRHFPIHCQLPEPSIHAWMSCLILMWSLKYVEMRP